MSANDPHVEFASMILRAELPTLTQAWGCENCGALRRIMESHRCIDCGSESIFNAAPLLANKVTPLQERLGEGGDAS